MVAIEPIIREVREALESLFAQAGPEPGALLVLGCSTSEIAGERIGQASQPVLGEAVVKAVLAVCQARGIDLAVQCCEHLNRALVLEKEVLRRHGFSQVMAVPTPKAGGSCAAAAYGLMAQPVLAAHIAADLGLDIGDTLIGMHLKPVAVPVRAPLRRVGGANLVLAKTRPPYVGGPRAQYEVDAER